jgi:hypothetical protein
VDGKFAIAIPFSRNDFQGGLSSESSVTITLNYDRSLVGNLNYDDAARVTENGFGFLDNLTATRVKDFHLFDYKQSPVCIFLSDSILKIRSQRPIGQKQWEISTASVEQVFMSQV